ncbi:MAG: tetratricopeptide repeat protein [Candidatus Gastranaerophilaceae bacterium]
MEELFKIAFDLYKSSEYTKAEEICNNILRNSSKDLKTLLLLGNIKLSLKEYATVVELNNKILSIDKNNLDAIFNQALAYKYLGKLQEAIKLYKRVIELNPNTTQAYYNVASICADCGDVDGAIYFYTKLLEFNPNDIETRYFMAIALMKNRQYKKGLQYFENRLCRKSALLTQIHTYPNLMKKAKLWNGEDIKNKTIYTYYEAGFGDVIMFSRYLLLLQERCKNIIFKPQVPLSQLFIETFPNIHTMKYFEPEKTIDFDYHIPILSLPYVLGLNEDNMFIYKDKYIKADYSKIEWYRNTYFNNKSFKIGFKWQGNTMYDWERVIEPEQFIKLFKIPNTKFYSFQTESGSENLESLNKYAEIIDIGKTLTDFSDTAAAIENLDLVICNDTSLAHVAGAMCKPCWILLPYIYNWRWHQDISKCDWYNSVKLFRQTTTGDWESVFDEIYKELLIYMDTIIR